LGLERAHRWREAVGLDGLVDGHRLLQRLHAQLLLQDPLAGLELAQGGPAPAAPGVDPHELAVGGLVLYTMAAARYWRLYRRRPSVILIAILTAFALLAEAMVAVALARNWHASWWEWHLLMAFAFAFVYYSAHVQYAREGSWSSLFRGIYLQETIQQIRREHGAALEALVEAMQHPQGDGAARPVGRVVADLADRFDLTEGQAHVLEQAAEALVAEREQIQRLRALVAVGAPISVYHYLVERFPALQAGACDPDNPCTLLWVWRFHYISIPLMAASAFALVAVLLLTARPGPAGSADADRQGEHDPAALAGVERG
jgi:hypothetical protein